MLLNWLVGVVVVQAVSAVAVPPDDRAEALAGLLLALLWPLSVPFMTGLFVYDLIKAVLTKEAK